MLTSKSAPIPSSLRRLPKGLRILTQVPHWVNRRLRAGDGFFSATRRAMEGRDQSSRVAVFVDGANLYHAIKSFYRGVLDYSRLLEAAVGDRGLLRATFYIVEKQEADDPQNTPSVRSFVYNLNKFGYKVRSKPLQVHETVSPDGERAVSHKGDWDVGIVVGMGGLRAHAAPNAPALRGGA